MHIKVATTEEEFEQIYRLNYETFVEEINQHEIRADKRLVDKYHVHNNYLIALDNNSQITGMMSYNMNRPFSLEHKGLSINEYIPPKTKVAEIRLLSVKKEWRGRNVLFQINKVLFKILLMNKISAVFISATTRQLNFYKKSGFIPFGELVGKEGAFYQPMYIKLSSVNKKLLV